MVEALVTKPLNEDIIAPKNTAAKNPCIAVGNTSLIKVA